MHSVVPAAIPAGKDLTLPRLFQALSGERKHPYLPEWLRNQRSEFPAFPGVYSGTGLARPLAPCPKHNRGAWDQYSGRLGGRPSALRPLEAGSLGRGDETGASLMRECYNVWFRVGTKGKRRATTLRRVSVR